MQREIIENDKRKIYLSVVLFQATVSRCVTRSTQTDKSNFRYGVHVQVAPPRNKEVQTRRDNYTNTKKLLTYTFGLRGRRDDNQHILSFLEDDLEHLWWFHWTDFRIIRRGINVQRTILKKMKAISFNDVLKYIHGISGHKPHILSLKKQTCYYNLSFRVHASCFYPYSA